MNLERKSYSKVGQLIRCSPETSDKATEKPECWDFREAMNDADDVLQNWIFIARFNIGASATLALLEQAKESLKSTT